MSRRTYSQYNTTVLQLYVAITICGLAETGPVDPYDHQCEDFGPSLLVWLGVGERLDLARRNFGAPGKPPVAYQATGRLEGKAPLV